MIAATESMLYKSIRELGFPGAFSVFACMIIYNLGTRLVDEQVVQMRQQTQLVHQVGEEMRTMKGAQIEMVRALDVLSREIRLLKSTP